MTGREVPPVRDQSVRQAIREAMASGEPLSMRDLSQAAHIPEHEVPGHLDHIRRSLHREEHRLSVTPAECRSCGFVFRKRERLTRPGACPLCRSTNIDAPLFAISLAPLADLTGPDGQPPEEELP
jgi:predicted Zn-ribbon and HTH transcriptional regulator